MRYILKARVSYEGEFEVEAGSPQEAVDKFKKRPTSFSVDNMYYYPIEVESIHNVI